MLITTIKLDYYFIIKFVLFKMEYGLMIRINNYPYIIKLKYHFWEII